MSHITKRVNVCIKILSIVLLLVTMLFVDHEKLLMSFRESVGLSFQRNDVAFIRIRSAGALADIDNVLVNDQEKIREIIAYLNSLELIETDMPQRLRWRINSLEDVGWIAIHIGESPDHNPGDSVVFWANYMVFSYHGHKPSSTYYVRNSGFCNRTKTSNIYYFLRRFIYCE